MKDIRDTSWPTGGKLVYLLASIPLADCILNQINNAFQVSFGGLSLLQLLRGYMVLIFIALSLWSILRDRAGATRIPLPAAGALLLIGVFITKELVVTGTLAMGS
ncbi:MAG TPA: hypothetical protein VHZ55_13415, partial [Bryobacteraceae bacterium]|nr:hypothetical protein [Bryobacteraceae bacterium]